MAQRGGIATLRHRVTLCSQKDVVTTDGVLKLNRTVVDRMWAMIDEKAASHFSPNGAVVGKQDKRTHVILIRYRPDLNISNMAWIYEERRKSSPRWFKILRVGQSEKSGTPFSKFEVRLVERSDDIPTPIEVEETTNGPTIGLPEGVIL